MRGALTLASLLLLAPACGTGMEPVDYGDPTAGGGGEERTLTVALLTPEPYTTVDTPTVTLAIEAATTQGAIAAVRFRLDEGPWEHAAEGAAGAWSAPASLRPGPNALVIRAEADDGGVAEVATTLTYGGADPSIRVTRPVAGGWAGLTLRVEGRADAVAPATLASVEVGLQGGALQAATLAPDGTFTASLPSGADAAPTLVARVTDSGGRTAEVAKPLRRDDAPPTVTLSAPAHGEVTDELLVTVTGGAADDVGLAMVEVQVGEAGWVVATGTEAFETQVGLAAGVNVVRARATDLAGNTAEAEAHVYRSRTVTLRPTPTGGDQELLTLTLDRAGLEALVPPEEAADIDMLYLDISGLLLEALKAMRDYQLYGVDTSAWGPAEWNMNKILTMSPDSADVSGTSLEAILGLAANLGIPVPVVLGDIGDIAPTDPFLSMEQLAQGVFDNIIAPHPGMVTDPADGVKKIPVSLGDALEDLVGLGTKLGPMGDHPGILFEATPAPVLLPNFAMTVSARTRLAQHDAIDVGKGKTYVFIRPPDGEILEFDFLNPDWFQVQGIADEPEVDLSFLIVEQPTFVPAGTSPTGNAVGGFERGDSPVWGLPTWTFEYLVADLMFDVYHRKFEANGYKRTFQYDVGSLVGASTIHWDTGWLTIETLAGVGEPPPPQFFWDAVLELAQVRLHDGGLAEGEADLHLVVDGVRVPLTADQLVEATRPVLEAQKDKLAEVMIGDLSGYSSQADVFLATGDDGARYLYFIAPADTPGMRAIRAHQGFYADAALTQKVSTTESLGSGDTLHEKVKLSAAGGEPLYVEDLDGSVWQLTTLPMAGDEVPIRVRPAGWTP